MRVLRFRAASSPRSHAPAPLPSPSTMEREGVRRPAAAQWPISQAGWCFSRSRYLRMTTVARSESLFLSSLPGRYYYDPAIFELEQEQIFSSMWVCAGRAESIPAKAGAYQVVTIGKESVIIV